MRLDSVELVMDIENYFGISIPDRDAEKAYTVRDMVMIVANLKGITSKSSVLQDVILQKLSKVLIKLKISRSDFPINEKINNYLSLEDIITLKTIEEEMGLKMPVKQPLNKHLQKIADAFSRIVKWPKSYEQEEITVEQFVDSICMRNSDQLIEMEKISSVYEIYIMVSSLTIDKMGVDYFELGWDKSFTNDLGVD